MKKHKADEECSGVRVRSEYVAAGKFTDLNLLNDYRFLEELGRTVDNAERNLQKQGPVYRRYLPYHLQRLVTECNERGINLLIMPHNFTRRKKNTSAFIAAEKKIFWHVTWEFPQAEICYTDNKVSEDVSISRALEKYLNCEVSTEDVRQRLSFYQSAGYNNVDVFMKLECQSEKTYAQFQMSKSLSWNLYKKTVIEHPTIIVVLKAHAHMYSLAPSDKEESSEDEEEVPEEVPTQRQSPKSDTQGCGFFGPQCAIETSQVKTQTLVNRAPFKDLPIEEEHLSEGPPISDLSDD